MQNELRALEQRWGLALQSAGFGVWDLDPLAQRVHYSPEWKAMLGYAGADEPDSTHTWRARVHPDELPGMVAALADHLQGRSEGYEREFRLRAADGGYRWVLSRGRVVQRDASGQALRVVGTLTDLTDRKEAEALREARDRALATNQAQTAFLSRMSHELRTPLNAVLGFVQVLSGGLGVLGPDEQRRYLGHIEDAGWHLLAMINDVLDLSRMETGQLALNMQAVPLAPVLRAVQQTLESLAQAQRVAVQLDWPADTAEATVRVRADPARLRQVFSNLLSNAIKYNRPGGWVRLQVRASSGPAPAWCVAVVDNGLGIDPAQLPHLFEPFNRLGLPPQGADGVGIGLVLTRWLLSRMDGQLDVSSVPDQGSTFSVQLRAA